MADWFAQLKADFILNFVKENKNEAEVLILPLTMDEIGYAVAKRVGVISVCDSGFSKKIKELLESGMHKA